MVTFDNITRLGTKQLILPDKLVITELDSNKNKINRKIFKFSKSNVDQGKTRSELSKLAGKEWRNHIEGIEKFTSDQSKRFVYERKSEMVSLITTLSKYNRFGSSRFKAASIWLANYFGRSIDIAFKMKAEERADFIISKFKEVDDGSFYKAMSISNSKNSGLLKEPPDILKIDIMETGLINNQIQHIASKLGMIAVVNGNSVDIHTICGDWKFFMINKPIRIADIHYNGPYKSSAEFNIKPEIYYSPVEAMLEIKQLSDNKMQELQETLQRRVLIDE